MTIDTGSQKIFMREFLYKNQKSDFFHSVT